MNCTENKSGVQPHIGIVGTLNAILGGLGVGAAIALFGFLRAHGFATGTTRGFAVSLFVSLVNVIGQAIVVVLLIFSVPGLVGGIGLLRMARWSRVFMIAVSALQLLYVPIGTLLGAYGLWCLTRPETRALFVDEECGLAARNRVT